MIFNLVLISAVVFFITFRNVNLFKDVSLDREEAYRLEHIDYLSKGFDFYLINFFSRTEILISELSQLGTVKKLSSGKDIHYMAIADKNARVLSEFTFTNESKISFAYYLSDIVSKGIGPLSESNYAILNGEKTPVGEVFLIVLPFKNKEVTKATEDLFVYFLVKKEIFKNLMKNDSSKAMGIIDSLGRLLFTNSDIFRNDSSLWAKIENEAIGLSRNVPLQKYINDDLGNDSNNWLLTLKKSSLGSTSFSIISKNELLTPANYMEETSIFFISILASVLIYILYLFSNQFSKPIEILEYATKKISEGNLDYKVSNKINTRDEVKNLANAFDDMVDGLREREKMQTVLNKFHGSKVATELLKKEISLGGEKKNVAILFSDIRGFTDFSEGHTSEEVVSMLNEYFEVMVAIINRHGGVVDKFIGDAIMAVWGIPHEDENDCKNALRACLDMRVELARLNDSRIKRNLVPIKIGIGLHYGEAISGQIGSQERMEFTVIGDTVNTASRIEGATKGFGVDLLVSSNVLSKLDESFLIQRAGNVEVQGKSEPLSLYKVDGIYIDGALKMLRTPYSHFEAAKDKKSKII